MTFKRSWEIEKGLPIPRLQPRTATGKTAAAMEPGDSVLCDSMAQADSLRRALWALKRNTASRKVDGGWRVWRKA